MAKSFIQHHADRFSNCKNKHDKSPARLTVWSDREESPGVFRHSIHEGIPPDETYGTGPKYHIYFLR